MAKFCGKCGAKLDETTGLCPNCDAEKLAVIRSEESENTETEQASHSDAPLLIEPGQEVASANPEKKDSGQNIEPISTDIPLTKKEAKKQRKKEKKAAKKAKKKEKRAGWSVGKKVRRFLLKFILVVLLLALIAGGVTGVLAYFEFFDIPVISEAIDNLVANSYSPDVEKNIPATDTRDFTFYQSSEENIAQDADTGITFVNNEILVTLISESYKNQLEEYLQSIGGRIVGEIAELAEYQILLSDNIS